MADSGSKQAHATPETGTATSVLPEQAKPKQLPMYRVILHNDDQNYMNDVVDSIVMPGAVVGPKSIVVRSLLCPDSQIQAGADIADAVVYAGVCLSDDRRACP